jgi:undecaprenyl-diphosphatase
MSILDAIVLGLVQGLTEFLPVSSSGHLVLVEHLLNVPTSTDITFEIFVHFGTLVSILLVFWHDVVKIATSVVKGSAHPSRWKEQYVNDEYFRLGMLMLIGSMPAAYVGLTYEDELTQAFADPKLVAVMLVITGLLLFLTRLAKPKEGKQIGVITAFIIGMAQAAAITPGISRSGSTISSAMYLGIPPVQAARFSFLLSLPAVAGATLLKTVEMVRAGFIHAEVLQIIVGTVIAFGSGYMAIKFLLRILERGQISWFALYCLVAGILGILFI